MRALSFHDRMRRRPPDRVERPFWQGDPTVCWIPTNAAIEATLGAAGFERITDHVGDESTHATKWLVADLRCRLRRPETDLLL